jgi:hypothetical protein
MWEVIGEGRETAIYETDNGTLSYEEAKAKALQQLDESLRPALIRVEEIKADKYQSKGKKPPFKAWKSRDDETLVIAKTKKRAMELLGDSRAYFDSDYCQEPGWWWYEYAQEESVWEAEGRGQWPPVRSVKFKKVWPRTSVSLTDDDRKGEDETE